MSLLFTEFVMRTLALLLLLLVQGPLLRSAAANIDYSHDRWPAFWIRVPGSNPNDYGVFHFRKSFQLESVPRTLRVFVSADNRYQLFVNGEFVSSGPARSDLFH